MIWWPRAKTYPKLQSNFTRPQRRWIKNVASSFDNIIHHICHVISCIKLINISSLFLVALYQIRSDFLKRTPQNRTGLLVTGFVLTAFSLTVVPDRIIPGHPSRIRSFRSLFFSLVLSVLLFVNNLPHFLTSFSFIFLSIGVGKFGFETNRMLLLFCGDRPI